MTETSSIVIKWAGKEYPIEGLTNETSVLSLKELIYEKTNVLPARQKLLNLKHKGMYHPKIQIFNSITMTRNICQITLVVLFHRRETTHR